LAQLRNYYSLCNADGTDFDPYTYTQLSTYLKGASAKNMAYILSAQLASMFLNIEMGYVDGNNAYIYTPGCVWWSNFVNVYNLMTYTNYYLAYKTTADGKHPDRGYLECLKIAFDNGNNNLTFVQPHPCGGAATTNIDRRAMQELNETQVPGAKIWPNPSNNHFTLRPAHYSNTDAVELKVYNINGQQIFRASGFSNKDYQFGDELIPGIYMVEFTQGNNKSSFKLVKQ
jgi:type IX secretion system substrate protein